MCRDLKFKPIRADQIEVRPTDTKSKKSCVLLLYIDSRSAADILNTTVGVFNWQIQYKDVAGQIYGGLSIYDEERKIWVTKEDTGEESNIAEKKGQASDILKRCIARWGCDWLYHTPRIRINTPEDWYYQDKLTMTFRVDKIEWDEQTKELLQLRIVNRNGEKVYDFTEKPSDNFVKETKENPIESLVKFCQDAKAKGADKDVLAKFYKFYEKKLKDGSWTGAFNASRLYENWVSKERKPSASKLNNSADETIQDYEERTLGADSESFYF